MDRDASCKPNIEVVFTTTPQALLDNIRKGEPVFLGYHDNGSQAMNWPRLRIHEARHTTDR